MPFPSSNDIAKMKPRVDQQGGQYVQVGTSKRTTSCDPIIGGATSKVKGPANGGVADRRRFIVGCALPGLDAVGAVDRRLGNEKCSLRFWPSKYEPHGSQ